MERRNKTVNQLSEFFLGSQNSSNQLVYQPDQSQPRWNPAFRLLLGLTGISLTYFSLFQKKDKRVILLLLSLALTARSVSGLELVRLFGLITSPVLSLKRTLLIYAPVELVYQFWKNFNNFPKFMSHVKEVSVGDDGTLKWVVEAPAGIPVSWKSTVTQLIPNQLIEWKSVPGSVIRHWGKVKMVPVDSIHQNYLRGQESKTQVQVELNFAPPVGVFGYAVAHLIGYDPGSKIDEDLKRMVSLIETEFQSWGKSRWKFPVKQTQVS